MGVEENEHGFLLSEGDEIDLATAVYQSVGAASMCWATVPTSVFDMVQAQTVAERLIAQIKALYEV